MTTYQLNPPASVRPDQLKTEIVAQLPSVTDVGIAGGTIDAVGLIFTSPARLWATFSADLSSADQSTLAGIVTAHTPTESLDDKLARLDQLAKTLAACVEALVRIKINNAALFTNVQPWVTSQITAAHNFIQSQGG